MTCHVMAFTDYDAVLEGRTYTTSGSHVVSGQGYFSECASRVTLWSACRGSSRGTASLTWDNVRLYLGGTLTEPEPATTASEPTFVTPSSTSESDSVIVSTSSTAPSEAETGAACPVPSACPSPTPSPELLCPGVDRTTFTQPDGSTWEIYCDHRTATFPYEIVSQLPTLNACLESCNRVGTAVCSGFDWVPPWSPGLGRGL